MIKCAIMGLGTISKRALKGMQTAKDVEPYAVASRDINKANVFKETNQLAKAYGNYEAMCLDSDIDLVYISTPNFMHFEHIMLCLKHGLHVICEKPLVSSMEQLEECFAYAKKQGLFLMEAEKAVFTPLNQKLYEMIQEGCIGRLRYIEGSYGDRLDTLAYPSDFWGYRQEDGGCAFDIGVYPIAYANYFAQSSLAEIQVTTQYDHGYTSMFQGNLQYENGIIANVRSSWSVDFRNYGYLYGEEGYLITENFWKNTCAYLIKGDQKELIEVSMESDFAGEMQHAAQCIIKGYQESPIMSYQASKDIMRVLEASKKRFE